MAYGVRSAVTRRASRTLVLAPAVRRQDASKCGQFCCEQSAPTGRISRRSAFASGRGTLASTDGAKPGRTARAAATHAAIATAEKVLIMTVPCHPALAALVVWSLHTNGPFPEFFAKSAKGPKMVSSPRPIVSSGRSGRNKAGVLERRAGRAIGSMADKINGVADGFGREGGVACGAGQGGVGRFHAPNCALPRLL